LKRATIDDVAEQAGVSKSTVSAVLNDSRPVTDETRRKVNEAVADLNYRPRASARQPTQTGRSLGLIIKERSNPFFADIASGVSDEARDAGYTLYTASSEGDYATENEIISDLTGRDVDGLIIYPVMNEETDLTNLLELRRARVPFVLMENIRGVQANVVDVSTAQAAKKAAEHLLEGGHRRIAHFAGPLYSQHSDARIDGMRYAFSETQIAFSDDLIVPAGARMQDGYEAALDYFDGGHNGDCPTAATCFNDQVALGVHRALQELGLDVPGDVSLVGCDGIGLLDYMPVRLTTIRSPLHDMGAAAASILRTHIEAGEQPAFEQRRFEPELVVRESTRAL
jgi:LacI family transcriptional regulator/LacI family repressor for deo operon, udp, cdd, tsx, nupC, and nupG